MKILFLCETITFSHICRPLELAKSLANEEIYFASTYFPKVLDDDYGNIKKIKIENGVKAEEFTLALSKGKLPYTKSVIENYVKEDLRILKLIDPDVVVSDFRISAPIACELLQKPLITLSNAIWSPYSDHKLEMPDLLLAKILGLRIGNLVLNLFHKQVFKSLIKPMNQVRKSYGLNNITSLFEMYTKGDLTLYLDTKEIAQIKNLPSNHKIIGPLMYSKSMAMPEWFSSLDHKLPLVFVSMGSSGEISNLKKIVSAIKELPINIVVANFGRTQLNFNEKNIFESDILPAKEILQHCELLIGNGGSPMNYLALCEGVAILGVPTNMDQCLSIERVKMAGAAEVLRSWNLTPEKVISLVTHMLSEKSYGEAAKKLSIEIKSSDTTSAFKAVVQSTLESKGVV